MSIGRYTIKNMDLAKHLASLQSLDRQERLRAVAALRDLRDSAAIPSLRVVLQDLDAEVCKAAAEALQSLGDTGLGKSQIDPYGQFGLQ